MPAPPHPRVPSVEPELLRSALFLFREYLARAAAESPPPAEDDEDDAPEFDIDTRAVLDLFADELGSNVQTTLALYLRATALYRLLARSPSLASLAIDEDLPDGIFTENALLAAARLDVAVAQKGGDRTADFDPRQFRDALDD
ncbi:MAG TPA: hypothetical protein VNF99_11895 [Stellaceae bacterium]|nr:hypothetical protein [Stellaceae bacterium]